MPILARQTLVPWKAQDAKAFPTKPITLIMPWPAGSGVDLWHRALADAASKILGQSVIDNKTGGTGTVGPATMALTSKPDGYTIAQIPVTVMRLPMMQKHDLGRAQRLHLHHPSYRLHLRRHVRADSPFKTWKDVVDYARANPGKITYATTGPAARCTSAWSRSRSRPASR